MINGCVVYRFGTLTQLTVGHLVDIWTTSPTGWFDAEGVTEQDDVNLEDDEWLGMVKWSGDPFSTAGDSGALVLL